MILDITNKIYWKALFGTTCIVLLIGFNAILIINSEPLSFFNILGWIFVSLSNFVIFVLASNYLEDKQKEVKK